jgi:choline-glycine betaine transporter
MSADPNSEPRATKRKGSALRVVANLAWLVAAGAIAAPSVLELSASATSAANVLSGLAVFVFLLCVVTGFVRGAKHHRSQARNTLVEQPKRPEEST